MTNFARINARGQAVDVSMDPYTAFPQELADQFVAVPDEVRRGWTKDSEGNWSPRSVAAVEAPTPIPETIILPVPQFMLRFTSAERVAIRASTDPVVKDWLAILDDTRLAVVHLDDPNLVGAVNYLASIPLIAPERVAEVLGT